MPPAPNQAAILAAIPTSLEELFYLSFKGRTVMFDDTTTSPPTLRTRKVMGWFAGGGGLPPGILLEVEKQDPAQHSWHITHLYLVNIAFANGISCNFYASAPQYWLVPLVEIEQPVGSPVSIIPDPARPSYKMAILNGGGSTTPAPAATAPVIPEALFALQFGGTDQEFGDSVGCLMKRNVAGYVISTGQTGSLKTGILFDFQTGDSRAHPQAITAAAASAHLSKGGDFDAQWAKALGPCLFLIPLADVVRPSHLYFSTNRTPKGMVPVKIIASSQVDLNGMPIPAVDLSRYPKTCPKCSAPAYLGLTWDCSNRSCR